MKIESAAGEFEFSIEALQVRDPDILITGKMGVWEAETVMTREDIIMMLGMMIRQPQFWGYLIQLPLHALRSRSGNSDAQSKSNNE